MHALKYVRALLPASAPKSVEPMALVFGGPSDDEADIRRSTVLAWRRLLTVSPWEAGDARREIQAVFNERFVPSASRWAAGVAGVVDESAFPKRGTMSVGVQGQWCGRLGEKENGQVGVLLAGATPAGAVLLDHQRHLPKQWGEDAARTRRLQPDGLRRTPIFGQPRELIKV